MEILEELETGDLTMLDTVELADGTLVQLVQSPRVEGEHTAVVFKKPDSESWQFGAFIELSSIALSTIDSGAKAIFITSPIPVIFDHEKVCPPDEVHLLTTTAFGNAGGTALRFVTEVQGRTYCGGTQGQVMRLSDRVVDGSREWDNISPVDLEVDGLLIFESLTGFADDDLYVVGYGGLVLHYDGSVWTKKETPTDYILTNACTHNGSVYACGVGGMLLKGRGDSWEVISDGGEPSGNMFAIGSVNGTLVCANEFGQAFKVVDDKVSSINGLWGANSFTTGKSGLWSSGRGGLSLFDGTECKAIVVPPAEDEEEAEGE